MSADEPALAVESEAGELEPAGEPEAAASAGIRLLFWQATCGETPQKREIAINPNMSLTGNKEGVLYPIYETEDGMDWGYSKRKGPV